MEDKVDFIGIAIATVRDLLVIAVVVSIGVVFVSASVIVIVEVTLYLSRLRVLPAW